MNRRKFLLATAISASLLPFGAAEARGLHGGGPAPTGNFTPQTIPVSMNNMDQANNAATPMVSFVQPFADGDLPGNGSVTAVDSSGNPVTVQMDALSTWPSGYLQHAEITLPCSETFVSGCTFNGTISGTTLSVGSVLTGSLQVGQVVTGGPLTGVTPGSTIVSGSGSTWTLSASSTQSSSVTMTATGIKNYTLTTSQAAPNTTLPAGWSGNPNALAPDIQCFYSGGDTAHGLGTNTYTVKLRSILANYSAYPWGTNYPLGGWRIVKSGPNCVEWHAWQYLINDSTGVPHGYMRCDMWVKALSPTGPYEIDVRTSQPNMWNTISTNSEKHNVAVPSVTCALTIKNGSTIITANGGPNDPRTVVFPNSAFNTSNNQISPPGYVFPETAIVLTSTGTLPTGLTANTPYWINYSGTGGFLLNDRYWLQAINGAIPQWQPNYGYSNLAIVQNNNIVYVAVGGGGTSGNSGGPSGVGVNITDGSCQWDNVSVPFTDQGTGTITATPLNTVLANQGWMAGDINGNPIWTGTGLRHQVFAGHDFNYLTQKSKAVPPYNAAAGYLIANRSAPNPYSPNENTGGLIWYQDTTGDGLGDQRIGYIDNLGVVALYSPTDPFYLRGAISAALSWTQALNQFLFDERNGLPLAGNNGPARNGTPYPNFPSVQGQWVLNNTGGTSKTFGVGNWAPWDFPCSQYGPQAYSDTSHTPCPMQVPYLRTGRACFADHMISYANSNVVAPYYSFDTISGTTYYGVINRDQTNGEGPAQLRAWGWALRTLSQALYFAPDSHPFKQVLKDYYNDHFAYHALFLTTLMPTNGRTFGTIPSSDHDNGGQAPWEYYYLDHAVCQERWRGGLTSASYGNVKAMFDYMDNYYHLFDQNMPHSLYYMGAYDLSYGPTKGDYTDAYTTPAAVFDASLGNNGNMATPYPTGNGIYDGGEPSPYVYANPQAVNVYAVIGQMALKMRCVADPTNTARATQLAAYESQMSLGTGVSAATGASQWAYSTFGQVNNYHAYNCF